MKYLLAALLILGIGAYHVESKNRNIDPDLIDSIIVNSFFFFCFVLNYENLSETVYLKVLSLICCKTFN